MIIALDVRAVIIAITDDIEAGMFSVFVDVHVFGQRVASSNNISRIQSTLTLRNVYQVFEYEGKIARTVMLM